MNEGSGGHGLTTNLASSFRGGKESLRVVEGPILSNLCLGSGVSSIKEAKRLVNLVKLCDLNFLLLCTLPKSPLLVLYVCMYVYAMHGVGRYVV